MARSSRGERTWPLAIGEFCGDNGAAESDGEAMPAISTASISAAAGAGGAGCRDMCTPWPASSLVFSAELEGRVSATEPPLVTAAQDFSTGAADPIAPTATAAVGTA
jgi:hypothetical protein